MPEFLTGKRILIISPENWTLPHVSKHHYALELTRRNNEVWYCGPNDTSDCTPEGVNTLASPDLPKGMRFFPAWLRKIFNRRTASYFTTVCGGKIDIVWTFDTSRLFDLGHIFPDSLKVLHITDLNMEFEWKKAIQQADICFGVSEIICKRLRLRHSRVFKIPHGCDLSNLSINSENTVANSAAYAGNLSIPYLNLHLLAQLIQHYPNVTFHFYGPYQAAARKHKNDPALADILALPNVQYHGTLPADKLRIELSKAAVLLLCYDQQYRDQVANPHKLMTYLSTGRPILSTTLLEYEWLSGLVSFEDNSGAYLKKFGEMIQTSDNKAPERIDVAKEHSYPQILQKISVLMETYVND